LPRFATLAHALAPLQPSYLQASGCARLTPYLNATPWNSVLKFGRYREEVNISISSTAQSLRQLFGIQN